MIVDQNQGAEISNKTKEIQWNQVELAISQGKQEIMKALMEKEKEYYERLQEKQKNINGVPELLKDYQQRIEKMQNLLIEQENHSIQTSLLYDQILNLQKMKQEANSQITDKIQLSQRTADTEGLIQIEKQLNQEQEDLIKQIDQKKLLIGLLQKITGVFAEIRDDQIEISLENKQLIKLTIKLNNQTGIMEVININPWKQYYEQYCRQFKEHNSLNILIGQLQTQ